MFLIERQLPVDNGAGSQERLKHVELPEECNPTPTNLLRRTAR